MEKFTQMPEKKIEKKGFFEQLTQKAGKVLRVGVAPMLFAGFLSSCGDHAPSKETLQKIEQDPAIEKIDAQTVQDMDAIIEKAKQEGVTYFTLDKGDGDDITLSVDTITGSMSCLRHNNEMKTNVEYKYDSDGRTIQFAQFFGATWNDGQVTGNWASNLGFDKETKIITSALMDRGVEDEGYMVDNQGFVKGNPQVAKDAQEGFKEGIKISKEVIENHN